jgi:hypothetical protein
MDTKSNLLVKRHFIKTFKRPHPEHLDNLVNNWMAENMDIEIVTMNTACIENQIVVTVLYNKSQSVDTNNE